MSAQQPETDIEWEGRARMAEARLAAQPDARARLAAAEERLVEAYGARGARSGTTREAQELTWEGYYRALTSRDRALAAARSVELDDVDQLAVDRQRRNATR